MPLHKLQKDLQKKNQGSAYGRSIEQFMISQFALIMSFTILTFLSVVSVHVSPGLDRPTLTDVPH